MLSRKCGSLDISQLCGPVWPFTTRILSDCCINNYFRKKSRRDLSRRCRRDERELKDGGLRGRRKNWKLQRKKSKEVY
jgi:hypothetical protein